MPKALLFASLIVLIQSQINYTFAESGMCSAWLDQSVGKLHSTEQHNLCEITANKPVLIVNTASHCGFTPQFTGLEQLYQTYKDQGLVIIGFPSDDFRQAAKSEEEAASVCYINYGVTFPMTEQIHVRGEQAHPIFQHLSQTEGSPKWNFTKYLVNRQGEVVDSFASWVTPESESLIQQIEALF